MEKDPFKEYLRESEPDKAHKGYAWSTASRRTDAGIVWAGRSEVSGTDPQIQQIGDRADTPDGTEPERLPGVH